MTASIFYDHSDTFHHGLTTGIQRVVRQLGHALRELAPERFVPTVCVGRAFCRVPIAEATSTERLPLLRRVARRSSGSVVEALRRASNRSGALAQIKRGLWGFLEQLKLPGPRVRPRAGDWYIAADSLWNRPRVLGALARLRGTGVRTAVVHYDLTPVLHSEWVQPEVIRLFGPYAEALPGFDVVFCISELVRQEFLGFCRDRGYRAPATVTIPLGYEIAVPRKPPSDVDRRLPAGRFALCVGSLEPRKNHLRLLEAFDLLWNAGSDLVLLIVGRPVNSEIAAAIRSHPRLGQTLFHRPDCDDAELELLYARCSFTVLPSLFEGYGLPLIESLARGKPCVCSDLSVFRDVAGDFALYASPQDPRSFATRIEGLDGAPQTAAVLAERIRAGFSPPTWRHTALDVLRALETIVSPASREREARTG